MLVPLSDERGAHSLGGMDLGSWELSSGVEQSPHVAYGRRGQLGLVVLDRPKAINSLTLDMVESLRAQLTAWAADDTLGSVAITGNGERGLCAGGDVVAVRRGVLKGGPAAKEAVRFFGVEYSVNRLIAHFPKPFIPLIQGVTMGGGVGLSGHGSVRLADPEARVAMPETIIGFFPDVGARHLLARCPGQVGVHLAMSGATISGADAVRVGLADAVVPAAEFASVLQRYAEGDAPAAADLGPTHPQSVLADDLEWIDECYAGDDGVAILARLAQHHHERARATAEAIRARSPFAVAFALTAVREAARQRDVDAVLDADLAIAEAFAHEPDFLEGVRSQLVDKDRTPRWEHADLTQVDPQHVQNVLQGLARCAA